MFGVDFNEFLLIGLVALLVIGPKDLPRVMRTVGYWVSKARGVAQQFRTSFDSMVRESELAEMEKKWQEENERIMRDHPPAVMAPLATPVEAAEPSADAGPAPEPTEPTPQPQAGA